MKAQTSPSSKYDKEDLFLENLSKKLDEITLFCRLHKIPFFWTAAVKNSPQETVYISDGSGTASKEINLKDDKIAKHLAVNVGFDVIPNRENLEIIMEESVTE